MEFVRPGTYIDFMRHRGAIIGVSLALVTLSLVSLFVPGPNFGIDFAGGTEVQLRFKGNVEPGELRKLLEDSGYRRPDVVAVEGAPNEYIVRVREVSSLPEAQRKAIQQALGALGPKLTRFEVSPGGDKLAVQFDEDVDEAALKQAVEGAGVHVKEVMRFGKKEEHRYELLLVGVADELVSQLQQKLGERGPETPRRVEWVGPKAGAQLRDAAVQAMLYAIAFIMVYVAFRFDLRFAPGGIVALLHDSLITLGIYVLLQKEVNLTTVAALLTIVGYSINDTIVVYDRIRENMHRMKDTPLRELINVSTSQMLSRTVVTSLTTLVSIAAFFVWGTPVIKDITFALFVGILIGTYSSIYVAAPLTEWMDERFFRRGAA